MNRAKWREILLMASERDIEELIQSLKNPLYISLESEKTDASEVQIQIRQLTKVKNSLLTLRTK